MAQLYAGPLGSAQDEAPPPLPRVRNGATRESPCTGRKLAPPGPNFFNKVSAIEKNMCFPYERERIRAKSRKKIEKMIKITLAETVPRS